MLKIKKHVALLLVLALIVAMGGVYTGCNKKSSETTVCLNEVVH